MRILLNILFTLLVIAGRSQPLYAELTKTEAKCGNGTAKVSISGGNPPYSVLWNDGHTETALTNLIPAHYTITVTDAASNDTTITFSIIDEDCDVAISNHFTPNDDGYNDMWTLINIQYYPNFELFVYNRWGQLVHKQTEAFYPWDGRHLGVPLPDGAYYYIFYFDKNDKKKILQGDVNILR